MYFNSVFLIRSCFLISCFTFLFAGSVKGQEEIFDAIENAQPAVVFDYLRNQGDVDIRAVKIASGSTYDISLIQWAVIWKNTSIVKALIDHSKRSADRAKFINEGFVAAVSTGNTTYAKQFMELGADINQRCAICHDYPVILAAYANDYDEILELLIAAGADLNIKTTEEEALIHLAVEFGDAPMVGRLIKQGADLNLRNANGVTALMLAAFYGHEEIFKALLSAGADDQVLDYDGYNLLYPAASSKNPFALKYLVETNWKFKGYQGYISPLELAMSGDDQELLPRVIEAGADLNAWFSEGITPLIAGVINCNSEAIKQLLKAGADVNRKDSILGQNALHFAAEFAGCAEPFKMLLAARVDVNALNNQGETPLHILLKNEKPDPALAKMFLKAGADPAIKDNTGKTPVDYAKESGNKELIKLLE